MLDPEQPNPEVKPSQDASLEPVLIEVGWSTPFILVEFDGEIYFRTDKQGNHLTALMNFRDELKEHSRQGEPKLIEAGRVSKTQTGIKIYEGYGGSTEELPETERVSQSIAFIRENRPDIKLQDDV